MLYRVTDPQHVYPIYAVEVLANNPQEAKQTALAAMMGCPLDEVDAKVVADSLAGLRARHPNCPDDPELPDG